MRKSGLQLGEYPNFIAKSTVNKLSERTHPLAEMPYYNKSSEPVSWREELIASERYKELVDSYCNTFGSDKQYLSPMEVIISSGSSGYIATGKENGKRKELCVLAEKIIREEWSLDKDEVVFDLEILEPGCVKLPKETNMESPLNKEEKEELKETMEDEIVKRRTINALAQGAALRGHYLFHLYRDEIEEIIPGVTPYYQKALISNDLFYYIISDEAFKQQVQCNSSCNAGYVMLDFSGDVPKIIAKAINLPILIHEMIKGIISLLSVAGLPKENADKVIDYTDTIISELWDIRLFPVVWANLHVLIDEEDYDIKKLIMIELFKKTPNDFIEFMTLLEHQPDHAKKEIKNIVREKRMQIMEYNFVKDDYNDVDLSDLGI